MAQYVVNQASLVHIVEFTSYRMIHQLNNPKCWMTMVMRQRLMGNHLKPLIKWSGGKTDELEMILPHIPFNIETYLEPFVGGGSLFFHLNPMKAVISDVHKELICLYQSIKDGKSNDIYTFMKETPNEEKTYYDVRDRMEVNSPLDIAKRFYYQRKTCFRGMSRYNKSGHFNICYGRYNSINFDDLLN